MAKKKKKSNAEPKNQTADGEVQVKCPRCPLLFRATSLPAHILVIHEIQIQTEYDREGKRKCYVCLDCAPYPGLYSTQLALDLHKKATNHK